MEALEPQQPAEERAAAFWLYGFVASRYAVEPELPGQAREPARGFARRKMLPAEEWRAAVPSKASHTATGDNGGNELAAWRLFAWEPASQNRAREGQVVNHPTALDYQLPSNAHRVFDIERKRK